MIAFKIPIDQKNSTVLIEVDWSGSKWMTIREWLTETLIQKPKWQALLIRNFKKIFKSKLQISTCVGFSDCTLDLQVICWRAKTIEWFADRKIIRIDAKISTLIKKLRIGTCAWENPSPHIVLAARPPKSNKSLLQFVCTSKYTQFNRWIFHDFSSRLKIHHKSCNCCLWLYIGAHGVSLHKMIKFWFLLFTETENWAN